jgi:hypothetical protein
MPTMDGAKSERLGDGIVRAGTTWLSNHAGHDRRP